MDNIKFICKYCKEEDTTILECEHNKTEHWCFNCDDATTIIEIKESEVE